MCRGPCLVDRAGIHPCAVWSPPTSAGLAEPEQHRRAGACRKGASRTGQGAIYQGDGTRSLTAAVCSLDEIWEADRRHVRCERTLADPVRLVPLTSCAGRRFQGSAEGTADRGETGGDEIAGPRVFWRVAARKTRGVFRLTALCTKQRFGPTRCLERHSAQTSARGYRFKEHESRRT